MAKAIPVKIQCACGQRYSFEVEPVNGQAPAPINCPVCGADGTQATNEMIAKSLGVPSGKKLNVAQRPEPSPSARSIHPPAHDWHAAQSLAEDVRRGRMTLLILFGAIILIRIGSMLILANVGPKLGAIDYVRATVLILMLLGIYAGIPKLKTTFIVLCLLGIVMTAFRFVTDSSFANGVEFGLTLLLAGVPAGVLLYSQNVNAFLHHQMRNAH